LLGFWVSLYEDVMERYLDCGNPRCGGKMRVVAFLTEHAVVDRIIERLKLIFAAEKPPPLRVAYQELLMEADPPADDFS
jgi:hypothetical protein